MRGCSHDHAGRRSPSITSSRPVASLTARVIGPLSRWSPNLKKSAIATKRMRTAPPTHFRARILLSRAKRMPVGRCPTATSELCGGGLFHFGQPGLTPLERGFLRQDAGGGVVHVTLAHAPRAELGQQLVEALAAEVEGLGVGAVAQPEHPIAHVRQIGPRRLEV